MISRMTTIVPTPMYIDDLPPGLTTPLIALKPGAQTSHGSSEQRSRWFKAGLERGEPGDCETFSADEL
jgi:Putative neutral zinc metallopeptidase